MHRFGGFEHPFENFPHALDRVSWRRQITSRILGRALQDVQTILQLVEFDTGDDEFVLRQVKFLGSLP